LIFKPWTAPHRLSVSSFGLSRVFLDSKQALYTGFDAS